MVSSSAPLISTNVHVNQNDLSNVEGAMGPPIFRSHKNARIDLGIIEALPESTKHVIITNLHENRLITA